MASSYRSKIDVFSHILTARYKERLLKALPTNSFWRRTIEPNLLLFDLEARFKMMDNFAGYRQVLTLSPLSLETFFDPEAAVESAKVANDELAELVLKYPERFVTAAACLPVNNMDAALREVDRAINDLGFRGIQINTTINGKPLDSPEFGALYEKMSQYDLPIWLHPHRPETDSDPRSEGGANFRISPRIGWIYELTAAMARLVLGGVMERYPKLKIISHLCGGMTPFFLTTGNLPVDYFKSFYADTGAIRQAAFAGGFQYWGADHLLFGTDAPYGGESALRQNIDGIEQLDISEAEKSKIFELNARKLLRLPGS